MLLSVGGHLAFAERPYDIELFFEEHLPVLVQTRVVRLIFKVEHSLQFGKSWLFRLDIAAEKHGLN